MTLTTAPATDTLDDAVALDAPEASACGRYLGAAGRSFRDSVLYRLSAGEASFELDFELRHAGRRRVRVHCAWRGAADAPALWVAGGISANRRVGDDPFTGAAGWWQDQLQPGAALDARRFRIFSCDWIGADGELDLPLDTADQADAIALALSHFGIDRLAGFVGASYGAMVGLQFALRHPGRVEQLVAISGAHRPHPFASAWRAVQRQILDLDHGPKGLALARQLAMLSYRTPEEFAARFDQPVALHNGRPQAAGEGYLSACGRRFVERTHAIGWRRLSESIDLHRAPVQGLRVPTLLIGVRQDRLVPIDDLQQLKDLAGRRCRLESIDSIYGHDAFLKEPEAIGTLLRRALPQAVAA
jgi:homoserine O-acetyltransferase